eukprot:scaffold104549_cov48-Phaeocystis_antarctica.AAC.2
MGPPLMGILGSVVAPLWSKAAKWSLEEAVGGHRTSSWKRRAARSLQAHPEEVQRPSRGAAKRPL